SPIYVVLSVYFLLPPLSRLIVYSHTSISLLLFLSMIHLTSDYTSTPYIYSLSLHDALPIFLVVQLQVLGHAPMETVAALTGYFRDRKSTRLNSSHQISSYAVFCL